MKGIVILWIALLLGALGFANYRCKPAKPEMLPTVRPTIPELASEFAMWRASVPSGWEAPRLTLHYDQGE